MNSLGRPNTAQFFIRGDEMSKTSIIYCAKCGFAYECSETETSELIDLHVSAIWYHTYHCKGMLGESEEREHKTISSAETSVMAILAEKVQGLKWTSMTHTDVCRGFITIERGYLVLCDHKSHWK